MKTDQRAAVRALLRQYDDGMSVVEIADVLGIPHRTARYAVGSMPDCYIDRWVKLPRGQHTAIWCAVMVPEHCPRPTQVTP